MPSLTSSNTAGKMTNKVKSNFALKEITKYKERNFLTVKYEPIRKEGFLIRFPSDLGLGNEYDNNRNGGKTKDSR